MFAWQMLSVPSLRSFLRRIGGVVLSLFCVLATNAQTTHTTLSLNLNDTYNGAGVHTSDGNYCTFSRVIAFGCTPSTYDCPNSPVNTCTFLTKIAPDGTASIFHTFTDASTIDGQTSNTTTNVDGYEVSSLIEASDGNLYGTALEGGTGNAGTIFKITKDGAFTLLYTFLTDSTNNQPVGLKPTSLIAGSDGNFYGVAWEGGPPVDNSISSWTIFKMTPTGILTVIYSFSLSTSGSTASSGTQPISLMQGVDGNFYGTTIGSFIDTTTNTTTGLGTIFSLTPTGVLTTLHKFVGDGSEGYIPSGQLVQGPDGALYGATGAFGYQYSISGPSATTPPSYGSIFKISTTGNFQILHKFAGGTDGWNPSAQLTVASDGNLYGVTNYGGNSSSGQVT